jgi:hypothetical protein
MSNIFKIAQDFAKILEEKDKNKDSKNEVIRQAIRSTYRKIRPSVLNTINIILNKLPKNERKSFIAQKPHEVQISFIGKKISPTKYKITATFSMSLQQGKTTLPNTAAAHYKMTEILNKKHANKARKLATAAANKFAKKDNTDFDIGKDIIQLLGED